MKNEIFSDLIVIELANELAGPSVGMFFAELGAKVIKIENPNQGDVTRSWKTNHESDSSTSAYFTSVNWGKSFEKFNLMDDNDYHQVIELIKTADIVITSYKPGDDQKLKMDYETLRKINPTLIYGQITGYGLNDDRTGYDAIIQAESGFMSMNGTPDSGPVKMPVALMDILAAHQLKEGLLTALIHRMKTGKGDHVHVSLIDAAVSSLANQASNYLMTEQIPQRIGSEHPNIVPYGTVFSTKDKKVIILAIGTDKQFRLFCDILDKKAIAKDDKFISNPLRVQHREELIQLLSQEIKKCHSEDLLIACRDKKIPIGLVKNLEDVFDNDSKLILDKKGKRAVRTVVFESHQIETTKDLSEPE